MATGKLAEVEEAAVRIQTKRFNEQFEEQEYQAAKKAEAQLKANKTEPVSGKETK